MNKENNSLDKVNIFSRIKAWWHSLFHKKKDNSLERQETIETTNSFTEQDVFDKYRKQNERNQYLLQLQKEFEKGTLKEKDIAENDRIDLETLYQTQIDTLKRNIKDVEAKIQRLKSI